MLLETIERMPAVIKFFAPVNEATIQKLMAAVDAQVAAGARELTLLLSTSGGSVFYGLSAYNYLKGLPLELTTHNFGVVESIGVPMYCSGKHRLCAPQARFLLHPVTMNFSAGASYEEAQLLEKLRSLRVDTENFAKVVSANTTRTTRQVVAAMRGRASLDADEARDWGLVHTIRQELFAAGAEVTAISS